jgi:hypothetical protein
MIVKKVPMSKTAAPKNKAAHVRDLADYIAGPEAGGAGEKLEHRGAVNFLNIDHEGQVREMVDLAETAKRSPQPVQHWILSWREGEQPTAAQADEAVTMLLHELGLAEHQAIYGLHRDTDNWHLHVAVNRVHPDTEKLVTVNNGFDHEVAHRAIARIEQRQGWEREQRALYEASPDGAMARARPRGAADRQPSARAREFEERTAERSAERVATEDAAPVIRRARTWRELHETLAVKGIRFEKKGSGALLWVCDQPVKASTAGRDCSMAALQKRLGDFVPGPGVEARKPVPRPIEPAAPGVRDYIEDRRRYHQQRDADRTQTADRQRGEWQRLAEHHRSERHEMLRGSWRGRRDVLNAARSLLAARQAQEKAALRERQRLERARLRRDKGRFPSYEEWLRRSSRDLANQWRHRDRRPPSIEGPTFEQPTGRDIRAFSAVVDGWRVHYHLTGTRGAPAFTDRGKQIDIHDGRREAVLAALQLSAQKWGTFAVTGGERFRQICVELAAEHGFKISNPDLQPAIAVERERIRQERSQGRPEGPAIRTPDDMTQAGIYRRHREEIVREQPHRQRQDSSRIDAAVAVRMSVTGHSREQIAAAIKDGARADRPNEKRDWDAYARRAADYALSPLGQQLAERLRPQEQRLLRLEGREDELDLLRGLGGPMRGL